MCHGVCDHVRIKIIITITIIIIIIIIHTRQRHDGTFCLMNCMSVLAICATRGTGSADSWLSVRHAVAYTLEWLETSRPPLPPPPLGGPAPARFPSPSPAPSPLLSPLATSGLVIAANTIPVSHQYGWHDSSMHRYIAILFQLYVSQYNFV